MPVQIKSNRIKSHSRKVNYDTVIHHKLKSATEKSLEQKKTGKKKRRGGARYFLRWRKRMLEAGAQFMYGKQSRVTCIMDHHSGIVWRGFGYVMAGRVAACSFCVSWGWRVWNFQLLVAALVSCAVGLEFFFGFKDLILKIFTIFQPLVWREESRY